MDRLRHEGAPFGGRRPCRALSKALGEDAKRLGALGADRSLDAALGVLPQRPGAAQGLAAGLGQRDRGFALVIGGRLGHEPHPLQHPDVAPDGGSVKLGEPGEFGQRDRSRALDPPHQAELRDADPGGRERVVVKRGRLAGSGAERGAIAGGTHLWVYTRTGDCVQPLADLDGGGATRLGPRLQLGAAGRGGAGRRSATFLRTSPKAPHSGVIPGATSGECGMEAAMCEKCEAQAIGRRGFLKFGAGALAAVGLGGAIRPAHAAEGAPTALTPDEALAQLKADNDAFVKNPEVCSRNLAEQREQVAGHQAPWATIVACADSRVPPELIFGGRGLGELFVARNAGNLVDVQTLGTLEYGAAVLGSPLIVVLAHTSCGAVKAACDVVLKNATYPGVIGTMIQPILPAALAVRGMDGDYVNNAARKSAELTAERLPALSTLISGLVKDGKLKIVAAIYDLRSGGVTFLS